MTAVAIRHQPGALSIATDQDAFTDAQLEAFGLRDATRGEQLVFLHTVQRTGLDPAARQIYSIARQESYKDDNNQWQKRTVRTIQTGIDGYRLIARRAADRARAAITYSPTEWCGPDGAWRDVWLSADPPAAARVTVYREGDAFPGIALFREYAQTKRNGELTAMWERMPAGQIAKCAEALALRKAFPQELAGIYTDDEMGQADHDEPAPARLVAARSAFAQPHQQPVTVTATVVEHDAPPITDPQRKQMREAFEGIGITDPADRLHYASEVIDREIASSNELTEAEADQVIARIAKGAAPAVVVEYDPTTEPGFGGVS